MKGTLTQWNRLEPRPRTDDFSRTLRAEIRDPLWMLTRQWQMGELTAEDTGSPVTAKLYYATTQLNKLQLGKDTVISYPKDLPLETVVERENIQVIDRSNSKAFINNIHLCLAFRKRLIQKINGEFSPTKSKGILKNLNEHKDLQHDLPDGNESTDFQDASTLINPELHQLTSALNKRTFHAGKLYLLLKKVKLQDFVKGLTASEKTKLDKIGGETVDWFDILFNQTNEGSGKNRKTAWDSNHLEYQFAVSAPLGAADEIVLTAKEYFGGRLDWFASDLPGKFDKPKAKLTQSLDPKLVKTEVDEVFPAEVEFKGMPHNRWWEFEDGVLNFGSIQPNKTDTGKILFAEFGLLFANDWSIMPLTIPFGSISNIDQIVIKDTFGQSTIAKHYKTYDDQENWGMFQLYNPKKADNKQDSQYLYVPPVVHDTLNSEPVEKINLLRDEMANMVWAIEQVIPDGMGGGADGYHMSRQVKTYYNSLGNAIPIDLANDAKIKYKLATEVPENWIPFIPVQKDDAPLTRDIVLQRASMPRIVDGIEPMRVEPRTALLLKEATPYYVFEEEVPRSGTIVRLHWQRTRMADGKTVVWLGRQKTNGRGEGFSNLEYDSISPKK